MIPETELALLWPALARSEGHRQKLPDGAEERARKTRTQATGREFRAAVLELMREGPVDLDTMASRLESNHSRISGVITTLRRKKYDIRVRRAKNAEGTMRSIYILYREPVE